MLVVDHYLQRILLNSSIFIQRTWGYLLRKRRYRKQSFLKIYYHFEILSVKSMATEVE